MKTLLSEEQLASRQGRIGSSEVPIIMGAKPGLATLWLEKTGRKPRDFEGNRFTEWGNRLEEPVAVAYAQRLNERGLTGVMVTTSGTVVHETAEWAQATPDRLVLRASDITPQWGLEIKTTGSHNASEWGPDGSNGVPLWVQWQARWCMFVTNLDRWDVAVLIGGSDFRTYTLVRDPMLEMKMVERVRGFFYTNVKLEVPPDEPLKWIDTATETSGVVREAESDAASFCVEQLLKAKQELAVAEAKVTEAEAELKRVIGSDLGISYRGTTVKWVPVKGRVTVDWKAVAEGLRERVQDPVLVSTLIDQSTKTGKPYRRLTVTGLSPKEDTEEGNA